MENPPASPITRTVPIVRAPAPTRGMTEAGPACQAGAALLVAPNSRRASMTVGGWDGITPSTWFPATTGRRQPPSGLTARPASPAQQGREPRALVCADWGACVPPPRAKRGRGGGLGVGRAGVGLGGGLLPRQRGSCAAAQWRSLACSKSTNCGSAVALISVVAFGVSESHDVVVAALANYDGAR